MTMETGSSTHSNESAAQLGISNALLSILVCPIDHGKLRAGDGTLTCTTCERTYTVEDGIPNMVVDTGSEVER